MKCVLEDTIIFTDEISEQSKDVAQLEEGMPSKQRQELCLDRKLTLEANPVHMKPYSI